MSKLREMLSKTRIGFAIKEVMSGSHEFSPGQGPTGRMFMEFQVRWGAPDLKKCWQSQDWIWVNELDGRVTVAGLCDQAACPGRLEMRYLRDASIRYVFDFEANGMAYRYVGEKVNIKPWNLPVSHTTCFGTLVEADSGKLISTSLLHFRLRGLPRFLTSIRFHWN
jgi:hypothetical protein